MARINPLVIVAVAAAGGALLYFVTRKKDPAPPGATVAVPSSGGGYVVDLEHPGSTLVDVLRPPRPTVTVWVRALPDASGKVPFVSGQRYALSRNATPSVSAFGFSSTNAATWAATLGSTPGTSVRGAWDAGQPPPTDWPAMDLLPMQIDGANRQRVELFRSGPDTWYYPTDPTELVYYLATTTL